MLRNDYKGGSMSLFKTIFSISAMIISALGIGVVTSSEESYEPYGALAYDTASEIEYFEQESFNASQTAHPSTTVELSLPQSAPTSSSLEEVSFQSYPPTTDAPIVVPDTAPAESANVAAKASRGTQVQIGTTIPVRLWTGEIPAYYGGDTGCSRDEANIVANIMWDNGADDDTVYWMLRTMSRESGCDPSAYNGNRNTGDNSYGLCQLNTLAGFFKDGEILASYDYTRFANDFVYNVRACVKLWTVCGRGPWNYGNYYCSKP